MTKKKKSLEQLNGVDSFYYIIYPRNTHTHARTTNRCGKRISQKLDLFIIPTRNIYTYVSLFLRTYTVGNAIKIKRSLVTCKKKKKQKTKRRPTEKLLARHADGEGKQFVAVGIVLT